MWMYDKKLEYPILIKNPNPALAKLIITQYGGPDSNKLQQVHGGCTFSLSPCSPFLYRFLYPP